MHCGEKCKLCLTLCTSRFYLCTLLLNAFVVFGLDPLCDVLCEHQAQTCRWTCKKTTVQTVCTHTAASAKRGKVTSITDWLTGRVTPPEQCVVFLCSLLSINNISQTSPAVIVLKAAFGGLSCTAILQVRLMIQMFMFYWIKSKVVVFATLFHPPYIVLLFFPSRWWYRAQFRSGHACE